MEYELVPPGCHQCNAAEVAIRNFKAHFLSILAGVADDFPLHQWDKLLPQAEITINLLRQSNATPKISAYAHMNGPFDYNKMPLAPLGCQVQVHEKTDQRGTWSFHSVDGWYLATSPEHYRTHKCHIKSTRSDRFSDTVQFMHKEHITNPTLSPADKLMNAIAACSKALQGLPNEETNQQVQQLRSLLHQANQQLDAAKANRPAPVPRVQEVPRSKGVQPQQPAEADRNKSSEGAPVTSQRVTRSMSQLLQASTTVQEPSVQPQEPLIVN